MIYASVCSGVEAASLAWMPLGWGAAWFSEIEPFPCAILKHRFPEVPNLGDMTKIKVETIENETGKLQRFKNDGADVVVPGGVDLLVGCSFPLAPPVLAVRHLATPNPLLLRGGVVRNTISGSNNTSAS